MDVEILVFDGVEDLDVFGPLSALANGGFEVALVADGEIGRASCRERV